MKKESIKKLYIVKVVCLLEAILLLILKQGYIIIVIRTAHFESIEINNQEQV